jgi:uncharacterized protein (TIGR03437 family)
LALNQDGSVNSQKNPAPPSSVVTIFASGPGRLFGQQVDGSITGEATSVPILPVAVLQENRSLEVLYAGNAPGLVLNTLQVNFRLPEQPIGDVFRMIIGTFLSGDFTLFVQ